MTRVISPTQKLDSASLLGIKARKTTDLIVHIEKGLPFTALEKLGKATGLTLEQVRAGIGISERTLARRKITHSLTSEESDRLVRFSRIFALAVELFEGNKEAARKWFLAPNRAFAGASPYQMTRTEVGAREVENLIGRLEHGVFN